MALKPATKLAALGKIMAVEDPVEFSAGGCSSSFQVRLFIVEQLAVNLTGEI